MNQSITYRFLKILGINLSLNEYGNVKFSYFIKKSIKGVFNGLLLKYCMYSVILSPLNYRLIRPKLWKIMGCRVGKNVFIGYEVWMDFTNAELIEIEENVHIANRCMLLCHQRNLDNYFIGDDYSKLEYKKGKIILKKGCLIGMDTFIFPNVTIGEGTIIGAGSLVTKDLPPYVIAAGRPARIIKYISEKK
jgi:acetyltransferase-like isoleucine patch superfamily enzyme